MLQPMLCLPIRPELCFTLMPKQIQKMPPVANHLSRRGLAISAVFNDGGAGRSFIGGGGKGPLGGGGRTDSGGLARGFLLFTKELLLLVLGGNIGRCEGSIAEAGSGMLSRSLKASRLARLGNPLRGSRVSSDKCCSDRGGGGDLSAIPVGVC